MLTASQLPKEERGYVARWIRKARREGWRAAGIRWALSECRRLSLPQNRLTFSVCDACRRAMSVFTHPALVPHGATATIYARFSTPSGHGSVGLCLGCLTGRFHEAYHAAIDVVTEEKRFMPWQPGNSESDQLQALLGTSYCYFAHAVGGHLSCSKTSKVVIASGLPRLRG